MRFTLNEFAFNDIPFALLVSPNKLHLVDLQFQGIFNAVAVSIVLQWLKRKMALIQVVIEFRFIFIEHII